MIGGTNHGLGGQKYLVLMQWLEMRNSSEGINSATAAIEDFWTEREKCDDETVLSS